METDLYTVAHVTYQTRRLTWRGFRQHSMIDLGLY